MIWADLPRGEGSNAGYRQKARIVEADFIDVRGEGEMLRVVVNHLGEHCACWPFSHLYFKADRTDEVYGVLSDFEGENPLDDTFDFDGPRNPKELVGREVFALTPRKYSNATYGLEVA